MPHREENPAIQPAGWGFFAIAVANTGRHADAVVLGAIGTLVLAGLWWRQRLREQ